MFTCGVSLPSCLLHTLQFWSECGFGSRPRHMCTRHFIIIIVIINCLSFGWEVSCWSHVLLKINDGAVQFSETCRLLSDSKSIILYSYYYMIYGWGSCLGICLENIIWPRNQHDYNCVVVDTCILTPCTLLYISIISHISLQSFPRSWSWANMSLIEIHKLRSVTDVFLNNHITSKWNVSQKESCRKSYYQKLL